jgi:hypothetical protein
LTKSLEQQARDLLARMAVLSDARSVSFIPTGASGKHDSSGTRGPGHVAPDDDLLGKWSQRFADPVNQSRLATLVLLAKRELEQRTHRKPQQTGIPGDNDQERSDWRETPWERDNRICDWYEGVPADEAAVMESACGTYCPAANIRSVRRRNDRDVEGGLQQTPREHRRRTARELRAKGLSLRKIAEEMNVSLATVQASLDGEAAEAA